jgi:hypothetical protein
MSFGIILAQHIKSIFFCFTIIQTASLLGAYPNPATSRTSIRFRLPQEETVSLTVVDMLGREVRTVIWNQSKQPGIHPAEIDLAGMTPGVYTAQLRASSGVSTLRLIVTR